MADKTISLPDLSLLKKVMGLSTSSNDPEALAALRKANAILSKCGLTWVDVLSRAVNTGGPTHSNFAAPADIGDIEAEADESMPIDQQIAMAFNELRNVNLTNRRFIDSLETQFLARRWLTEAQRAPLFRTVRGVRRSRGQA